MSNSEESYYLAPATEEDKADILSIFDAAIREDTFWGPMVKTVSSEDHIAFPNKYIHGPRFRMPNHVFVKAVEKEAG